MAKDVFDALIIHDKPVSPATLKRLILVFDRVFLIDPAENRFLIPDGVARVDYGSMQITVADYGVLYNGDRYTRNEERLLDDFEYARSHGVLQLLDLRTLRFYERHWLPLRLAYELDTANERILMAAKSACEINPDHDVPTGVLRGFFVQPSGIAIYPEIPPVPPVFTQEEKDNHLELQAFTLIGKLDRSLAVSGEYDLIPAIVNPVMAQVFLEKARKIRGENDNAISSAFQASHGVALSRIDHFLYRVSEQLLPDEVLDQISVKELVIARNNTFDKLSRLRRKVVSAVNFLSAHEFDEHFLSEVEEYISGELSPLIKAYDAAFSETLPTFLKYELTFAGGFFGYMLGLVQGLNPLQVAFLTGMSATVGQAVNDLATYLTTKAQKRFRNTYGYFLGFRD